MVFTQAQQTAFYTDPAQMGIPATLYNPHLINQGIQTADDLLECDDELLDNVYKQISRMPPPAPPAAPFIFSAKSLARIKTAARAVRFYDCVDRTLTPGIMQWTPTLSAFKEEMDAIKIAQNREEPDVPKITKTLQIMEWIKSFQLHLNESYGAWGFPINYVIRDTVAVPAAPAVAPGKPYSTAHGSLIAEFTARARHGTAQYAQDNERVFAKLYTAVENTSYRAALVPYERQPRNGRGAYLALLTNHLGKDKYQKEIDKWSEHLMNSRFKGNGLFTLERFISGHRNAYQALVTASQHVEFQLPNEYTRISYLLKAIHTTDPKLLTAIAQVESSTAATGPRHKFDECARILQLADPVAKRSKRPHAQISAVAIDDKTVTWDDDSEQGLTVDIAALKSGIGKTGVHLRFYKWKEYNKLTPAQKQELAAWRETPEGKAAAAKGKTEQKNGKKKRQHAQISDATFEKELKRRLKKNATRKNDDITSLVVSAIEQEKEGSKATTKDKGDSVADVNAIVLSKILGRTV